MCGINGFNFQDKNLIQKMNQQISHRGPDDKGIFIDKNTSLGNVRLSIIDLSSAGRMPMISQNKRLWITYNGEIYNFSELKKDLIKKGYKFRSNTDTEVILSLYEKYSEKCLQKLNGMFAFAIWDKNKRQFFLARDRVGIKPLYYFWDGDRFIFSSEIKALLLHKIPKEIDLPSFQLYMRLGYVSGEKTMFRRIYKLLPGHFLIFKDKKIKIKKYWELSFNNKILEKEEAKIRLRELLTDSVENCLVADRPVGIFLSGGIDSTILLGLSSKIKRNPIETFSVGFDTKIEENKYNSDLYLARKSAKIFNSRHHELFLSSKEALKSLEKTIWHLDEPIANPNAIPILLLSRLAKQKVAVVLGGDGGDELFGGYNRYREALLLSLYQRLPQRLRKHFLNPLLQKILQKDLGFANRLNLTEPLAKYFLFMGDSEEEIDQLVVKNIKVDKLYGFLVNNLADHESSNFLEELSYLDFKNWLPEESLIKSDKMTMAGGLEQRVPFLDHQIAELAFKIPWQLKLDFWSGKKILKEAFSDILPKEILTAPKRGFFTPAAKWLRDERWQKFVREILSAVEIKKHGLWNFRSVNRIIVGHINGKKYNLSLIWTLLTFQIWFKKYIDE